MAEFYWEVWSDAYSGLQSIMQFRKRKQALRWMNEHRAILTDHTGGRRGPQVLPGGQSYDWLLKGGMICGRGHQAPEPHVGYLSVSGRELGMLDYGTHATIAQAAGASRVVESLLTDAVYVRSKSGGWTRYRGRTWQNLTKAVRVNQ